MKKSYRSNKDECYFRIGKALIKIEFNKFKNGIYTTENELFQRAIENSELFKCGVVTLIEENV